MVNPGWLRFGTFIVLLPLILFQAAGYRRPIKSERSVGFVFGGGVGVLYSVTTISGPPLAVMLSNQGLTQRDFRAALGFIRLAESSFTAIAYGYAGLYTVQSMALIPYILPSIAIGVPIGAYLIQRIRPETFRRLCMSFDAWIVGFGLSTLLKDLGLVAEQPRIPRARGSGPARLVAALSFLLGAIAPGQTQRGARSIPSPPAEPVRPQVTRTSTVDPPLHRQPGRYIVSSSRYTAARAATVFLKR